METDTIQMCLDLVLCLDDVNAYFAFVCITIFVTYCVTTKWNLPCDVHMCNALTNREALLSSQWPLQSSTDVWVPFSVLSGLSAVKWHSHTRTHRQTHIFVLGITGISCLPMDLPRVACLLPVHMAILCEQLLCVWDWWIVLDHMT